MTRLGRALFFPWQCQALQLPHATDRWLCNEFATKINSVCVYRVCVCTLNPKP